MTGHQPAPLVIQKPVLKSPSNGEKAWREACSSEYSEGERKDYLTAFKTTTQNCIAPGAVEKLISDEKKPEENKLNKSMSLRKVNSYEGYMILFVCVCFSLLPEGNLSSLGSTLN